MSTTNTSTIEMPMTKTLTLEFSSPAPSTIETSKLSPSNIEMSTPTPSTIELNASSTEVSTAPPSTTDISTPTPPTLETSTSTARPVEASPPTLLSAETPTSTTPTAPTAESSKHSASPTETLTPLAPSAETIIPTASITEISTPTPSTIEISTPIPTYEESSTPSPPTAEASTPTLIAETSGPTPTAEASTPALIAETAAPTPPTADASTPTPLTTEVSTPALIAETAAPTPPTEDASTPTPLTTEASTPTLIAETSTPTPPTAEESTLTPPTAEASAPTLTAVASTPTPPAVETSTPTPSTVEKPTTFADVFSVKPLTSHTYSVELNEEWCIGNVPNGGYITSLFLLVARIHLTSTQPARSQPNPINLHLEFLSRTSVSTAVFTVREIKLGARISNLHMTLSQIQGDGKSRDAVEGYVALSNLDTEEGLSLPITYPMYPAPLPIDLSTCLENGEDENWVMQNPAAFPTFRRAAQNMRIHLPKPDRLSPEQPKSMVDQWVRFSPHNKPGKWTNDSMGFVVDMFPMVVEEYLNKTVDQELTREKPPNEQVRGQSRYWYPTLALNLDVKKLLPEEGVEWLFVRVQTKMVRNGRMDLDILVKDAEGDIVACSSHASLILSKERNLGPRRKVEKETKI